MKGTLFVQIHYDHSRVITAGHTGIVVFMVSEGLKVKISMKHCILRGKINSCVKLKVIHCSADCCLDLG